MEHLLQQAAQQRPVTVVSGCRQAGKTAALKQVFPQYNFVSLDSPFLADQAARSGASFLARYATPLIVDEVQYAPELLRHIKAAVDQDRQKMGQYFLTGSQKFQLMQGVSESLAGRVRLLTCHALSALELERHLGQPLEGAALLEVIVKGGYPEVYAQHLPLDAFYSDYLSTYLERDVRHVLQVRNLRDFARFMRLLAARSGQLFSMQSVAADLGISGHTVRSWLTILEASNIVVLLEPYFRNATKRLVKTPNSTFSIRVWLAFSPAYAQQPSWHAAPCWAPCLKPIRSAKHSNGLPT